MKVPSQFRAHKAPRGRWVIAHRGLSGIYPENTMLAFEKALELGVDALELDVHLSSDGQVVVMHDHLIDRTTSGEGAIAELTLAQIQGHDAGSWKGEEYAGQVVPILKQVLELAKERSIVMVEMKAAGANVVEAVVKAVKDTGMSKRVVLASFDDDNLLLSAELLPATERLALGGDSAERTSRVDAQIGAPNYDELSGKLVNDLHRQNRAAWVWTLDDSERIYMAIKTGVDGIISNYPDKVLDALSN